MALPNTFAAVTQATGAQLDANFNATGKLGIIPCAVSGTNSLVLTPTAGIAPTISAYADYLQFSGVAAASNTGALTARIGALAVLNVYVDSPAGPVACVGGEIIIGCAFTLRYDSALNSGAGGFHLFATTAYNGGTITNANLIMTGTSSISVPFLSCGSLASVTALMVGASAATITRVLSAAASLGFTVVPANSAQQLTLACPGAQVGDVVGVAPPASVTTGMLFNARVLAAGTVAVTAFNVTAASLVPATGTFRVDARGYA